MHNMKPKKPLLSKKTTNPVNAQQHEQNPDIAFYTPIELTKMDNFIDGKDNLFDLLEQV